MIGYGSFFLALPSVLIPNESNTPVPLNNDRERVGGDQTEKEGPKEQ